MQKFHAPTYRENLLYDVVINESLSCRPEYEMACFIKKVLQMTDANESSEKGKKRTNTPRASTSVSKKCAWTGSGIIYCRTQQHCEDMYQ